MKTHISANEATYGPQQYKTFAGALTAFFSEECPQLGGMRTRQVLSSTITTLGRLESYCSDSNAA